MEALEKDYSGSILGTDENSRAYRYVMRGDLPTDTSSSTYSHVAFRLLKIRFMDIISSLEKNSSMEKGKGKAVEPAMEQSGLQIIVS